FFAETTVPFELLLHTKRVALAPNRRPFIIALRTRLILPIRYRALISSIRFLSWGDSFAPSIIRIVVGYPRSASLRVSIIPARRRSAWGSRWRNDIRGRTSLYFESVSLANWIYFLICDKVGNRFVVRLEFLYTVC